MTQRVWTWIGSSVLVLAVLAFVMTSVEAYKTVAYKCDYTGSEYGYHLWPGGLRTASWTHRSPLEKYLATGNLGRPVEHRWSRCAYMGTTVLGNHISFSDGPVGGIVRLSDADLQTWMDHHSRQEIVGLYEFFRRASLEDSVKRSEDIYQETRGYK